MPLNMPDGETVITAHASKTSKIKLIFFEVHTSVLLPLMAIPLMLFTLVIDPALFQMVLMGCIGTIFVLIILERRGITLAIGLKRLRARLAGRHRHSTSRGRVLRRRRLNSFRNR